MLLVMFVGPVHVDWKRDKQVFCHCHMDCKWAGFLQTSALGVFQYLVDRYFV